MNDLNAKAAACHWPDAVERFANDCVFFSKMGRGFRLRLNGKVTGTTPPTPPTHNTKTTTPPNFPCCGCCVYRQRIGNLLMVLCVILVFPSRRVFRYADVEGRLCGLSMERQPSPHYHPHHTGCATQPGAPTPQDISTSSPLMTKMTSKRQGESMWVTYSKL